MHIRYSIGLRADYEDTSFYQDDITERKADPKDLVSTLVAHMETYFHAWQQARTPTKPVSYQLSYLGLTAVYDDGRQAYRAVPRPPSGDNPETVVKRTVEWLEKNVAELVKIGEDDI